MAATLDPHADGDAVGASERPATVIAENLRRLAIPPGTPVEARVAIERLIELTSILARRSAQLQEALDSRVVIEQAKGIVAERYSVSVDDSFRMLRSAARSNRMPLHDLAARVVSSAETPAELRIVVRNARTRGAKA